MEPARALRFAAVMWLAASAATIPARADAPTPEAFAASDTAGLHALVRADRTAEPATLSGLRRSTGKQNVRVRLGYDTFVIRNARPEPEGLAFMPGELRGEPVPIPSANHSMVRWPALPDSPIDWDRIDRIEVRKPSGMRGATVGLALASVYVIGVVTFAGNEEIWPPVVGGFAGAFMIVGAGVGSLIPHWRYVCYRPAPAAGAGR